MFYCFDNSAVEIMNERNSAVRKSLVISFNMPSDLCDLDADEIECVPHVGYK